MSEGHGGDSLGVILRIGLKGFITFLHPLVRNNRFLAIYM